MKLYIIKSLKGKISAWFTIVALVPIIYIFILTLSGNSAATRNPFLIDKSWLILLALLYMILAHIAGRLVGGKIGVFIRNIATKVEEMATGNLTITSESGQMEAELAHLDDAVHRLSHNLLEATEAISEIAGGNLGYQHTPHSDNGRLCQNIVLLGSNFRDQICQIKEVIEVLAASATEISASSSQVTAGASESSVAIAETTITLDEVRQTAQVAKEKAKDVSERANRSMEISRNGIQAARESLTGMEQINKQMDSVADAIMKLSEQSQSIGGIIATVNDISDQSNMLSVNAAIEASKAGEFGKGFAVVADEVRNLSEQSKSATEQVRKILHNISSATGTAVMATEQSSKAVRNGKKLVSQASSAIEELSSSIEEAARAAVQISASSQQQVAGVDQMVTAMENIRQSSGQNVASMSQLETAARELTKIGEQLNVLMRQYSL